MMPEAKPTTPSASTICFRLLKLERLADSNSGAQRAEHRGRMKARLVHQLRRDEAEPAHQLDAHNDAFQRRLTIDAISLADGEHRRHDHGAGVDQAALEGVACRNPRRGRRCLLPKAAPCRA